MSSLPISLFDYELPDELIAQEPLDDRSASRLLVLERQSGKITHTSFRAIEQWLKPGDLLVLNDTRVFPARLHARRSTGGNVELLLLEQEGQDDWKALARPSKRLRVDEDLQLLDLGGSESRFRLRVKDKFDDGTLRVALPNPEQVLSEIGNVPLPHYIWKSLDDPERYQTVFARSTGSVAAPTAGLHFTDGLLDSLRSQGIDIAWVTLHVGPGTFQPVKTEDALLHSMHSERYHVPEDTVRAIREAKSEGRRVIAVGTTSCRTLESIASNLEREEELTGETDLYITPGFEFRVVDGLLTNFHLPKSTLLLLVSAFAGRELVLRSYSEAIAERYRFYSFGDAMLIL
jgi:S-adenosylmethionine:tRNA ribosyltransferase-isomerase